MYQRPDLTHQRLTTLEASTRPCGRRRMAAPSLRCGDVNGIRRPTAQGAQAESRGHHLGAIPKGQRSADVLGTQSVRKSATRDLPRTVKNAE